MIACPGCGANLTFDISSQQMKCGYCGNIYDPYRFDNMEKDADDLRNADSYEGMKKKGGATNEQTIPAHSPVCDSAAGRELLQYFMQVRSSCGYVDGEVLP